MILKASQRGGGKQLALHLLKTEENEHVEVYEVRGFISEDIVGAMKEAYAVSKGTRCKQFLFSVSLNPPETESVGIDTFKNAADRIEEKTGLTGHPRVIVFHEKFGRRHAHIVWSRIDADTMTARNLSHFKFKLRDISRELYLEHDWKMPAGLMNSSARDPRNFTLAEWQQAKRMGPKARDIKVVLEDSWAISDSRTAFEQALNERGLILARGDRRGHVVVTHDGEVLSVARYIGKRAKDVRAKLGEPDNLPSVETAKARMALEMKSAFKRQTETAQTSKSLAVASLDLRTAEMAARQRAERAKLRAGQKQRWVDETLARVAQLKTGLPGLWQRLTGEQARIVRQNEGEALEALARDRSQQDDLIFAHLRERQSLQMEIRQVRSRYADLFIALRHDRKHFDEIARSSENTTERFQSRRRRRPRRDDPSWEPEP